MCGNSSDLPNGIDIYDRVATFEFYLESLRLPAKREAVDDGGGLHAGRGLDAVDEASGNAIFLDRYSRVWGDLRRSGGRARGRAGIRDRWRAR